MGSYAEAARQLDMPTTTLSRRIAALEQQLGGKLMQRTTRSLSLTELGEAILPQARLVEETIHQLGETIDALQRQPQGTLQISASRSFAQHVLAPQLADFAHTYPGIQLDLHVNNRRENLVSQHLDFAFRAGPLQDSSLIAMPVGSVRYHLVASPELIAKHKDADSLEGVLSLPRVLNHIDGALFNWPLKSVINQVTAPSVSPQSQNRYAVRSDDFEISLNMAIQGVGVALLPHFVVAQALQSKQLVSLHPDALAQDNTLYLVYSSREYLPSKSQCFLDWVRAHQPQFAERLQGN